MEMVKNTEDELHHPTNRSPESNHTLQMLDSNFVSIQCLLHLQVRHLNFHWGQESLAQAESFGHHWRGHHSRKGRGLGLGCVGFDRCCERIQKLSYFCLHKSLVENEFLDCWFVIFQYLGPRVIFLFPKKGNKTSDTMNDILFHNIKHIIKNVLTPPKRIQELRNRFSCLLALANGQGPVLLSAPIPFHPFHLHWQRSCAQWTVALPNCSRGLRFSGPSAVDHLMRKMLLAAWMVWGSWTVATWDLPNEKNTWTSF